METLPKEFDKVVILELQIKQIFSNVLQVTVERISDATTPDAMEEWDSVNHLILIATFEEEFSIDIEPEDIPKMMDSFYSFRSFIQKIIETNQ